MNTEFTLSAREEMAMYGVDSISLQQILGIALGCNDARITGELASYGVHHLSQMSEMELSKIEGVTKGMAAKIVAIAGFGHKMKAYDCRDKESIRSPNAAASLFKDLEVLNQEHFVTAYLNSKNQVIHKKTIFIGSLNATTVHPREIFKEAIRYSAAGIIVAHNHPSGNPLNVVS